MIYRVIGLMSGSSLDGLDIAFVELEERGGKWNFSVLNTSCIAYQPELENQLRCASALSAYEFMRLDANYGRYIGNVLNKFITDNELGYKVSLITSHGHTVFHEPGLFSTQIGDGASIAATTGLPVVSNLRSMDVALGGQGAPIVPLGEKLLFQDFNYFLNIGGIANISHHGNESHLAFDVCPANRVLNMLSMQINKKFDEGGQVASQGSIDMQLLQELNQLPYYQDKLPKSLANEFGTEVVFPLILSYGLSTHDSMATYVEHIATQVSNAVSAFLSMPSIVKSSQKMLITGGGAFNEFLISSIQRHLNQHEIQVEIPDPVIVEYKEAIIMALLGVLRWREEDTVLSSVTGSSRNSIGGALWLGSH